MSARSCRAINGYVEDDSSGDEEMLALQDAPQLLALQDVPVGEVDVPEASRPTEAGNFVALDPGKLVAAINKATEVVRDRQYEQGVLPAYNNLKLKDNHTWKNKSTLAKFIGSLRANLKQHFDKMQAAAT